VSRLPLIGGGKAFRKAVKNVLVKASTRSDRGGGYLRLRPKAIEKLRGKVGCARDWGAGDQPIYPQQQKQTGKGRGDR